MHVDDADEGVATHVSSSDAAAADTLSPKGFAPYSTVQTLHHAGGGGSGGRGVRLVRRQHRRASISGRPDLRMRRPKRRKVSEGIPRDQETSDAHVHGRRGDGFRHSPEGDEVNTTAASGAFE